MWPFKFHWVWCFGSSLWHVPDFPTGFLPPIRHLGSVAFNPKSARSELIFPNIPQVLENSTGLLKFVNTDKGCLIETFDRYLARNKQKLWQIFYLFKPEYQLREKLITDESDRCSTLSTSYIVCYQNRPFMSHWL